MRVRDLGALSVAVGTDEHPVAGTRGAAMLALLTINVNQRVSVDSLMAAAWGDSISPGAASTLASHVWRLRQLLEPGRDRRQSPAVLINDSDGYRLVGGPSTVDSLSFAEAAAEVRDLLVAGDAQAAVRRADAALALWRGQPYGGLAEADWAQSAVARLEELRGQLQECRIEGLLASGAVDTAISDLRPLTAAMPFRESLRALQMEALYRSGRAEEALNAYRQARQVLRDEIGIEPGAELKAMHERILRGDPALSRRVEPRPSPPRDVEVHLPYTLTPLVGRDDVLGPLSALVRGHRLVTITGAAGCGKTRVAVDVARAVAQDFPDGVWFVDLTAVSDLDLVVDVVVSTIGFAASAGATALQDLRRYLQTRRILLVLDNCEHVLPSVDQIVRVILGDSRSVPECCILTTSREPIGITGETVWTLEPLGLPDEDGQDATSAPAVQLFLQRLTALAPALDVDDHVIALAAQISVAVDGLPLPLELAAARALSHSLDDVAAQVTADLSRLGRVGRAPQDHRATVRSAIEWSHQLLSPAEQQAHRRLSVLPGAFTAGLAGALVGAAVHGQAGDADNLLAQLVHRSLLASEGSSRRGRPTAFRQLATVRSHALHALDDAGETQECVDRRDAWTTALIASRPPLGTAPEGDWDHALDDNYATVRATLARRLLDEPSAEGGRLTYPLTYYWYYRGRLVEGSRWLQLGHDLLRGGDPTDELLGRLSLSAVLALQRREDQVRPLLDGIGDQVRAVPSNRLVEVGEALAGLSVSCYTSEAYELLVNLDPVLRWVAAQAQDANVALLADAVGCCALLVAGQLEASVDLALSVHHRADAADHLAAGFISTAPLIIGALQAGRPDEGIPWVDRCATLQLRLGSGAIGMFTETKANFTVQLGDYAQAARMYAAARTATRRAAMGWPNRAMTPPLLALTRERLSRDDFERAWQEGEGLTVVDVFGAAGGPPPSGDHTFTGPALTERAEVGSPETSADR